MEDKTNSDYLKSVVIEGMQDRKATDIVVLDLKKVKNAVADYFVICTGNSDTQLDAIGEAVEESVYKNIKQHPWQKEGKQNKEWILIDYVDVVVHIFKKERREFFALEELWGDAILTKVAD